LRHTIAALFGAAALGILCAPSAFAADMSLKAVRAAPAAYNWTGFYAGVNVGGVWGSADTVAALNPNNFAQSIITAGTADLTASGFTGGGQVGYNWQFNNIVTGLEADFNYTGLSTSRSAPTPPFVNQVDQSFRSRWLATVRGRLGVAWDRTMIYGTGGLAVADVDLSDVTGFGFFTASSHKTRAGWTVGGGAEWAFAPKWSVKAEYLYVDLGTVSIDFFQNLFPQSSFNHRITESVGRLGLNYRF